MCYSQPMSLALALVGAFVAWALKGSQKHAGIRRLFIFYTLMEGLQGIAYSFVDDCGGTASAALAFCAHALVVVQPYMWNRHRAAAEEGREAARAVVFDFAANLSVVWAVAYTARLVPWPTWAGYMAARPRFDDEISVGALPCIVASPHHIAWVLPYRSWHGIEPNLFTYLLLWFAPALYERERPLVKLGVWLLQVAFVIATCSTLHEIPTTWCALSVPMLLLALARDGGLCVLLAAIQSLAAPLRVRLV